MQSNIDCITNSRTRGGGLHALVDELTLSPSSPIASSTSHSVFGTASTLMCSSSAVTSANPTSQFSSGTRVQVFDERRLNFSTKDSAIKEVDDPTTPSLNSGVDTSQIDPRSLRRLYSTPSQQTWGQSPQSNSYRGSDSVKLEEFLYTRGFLEGICSDITIVAFGNRYRLHRLILDRSPFFSSCFNGGPWVESTSPEISLSPEKSDPNIVQHAFELALARLYGHVDKEKEDQNALSLFAVASYLELQDLAESCVGSLLRNLKISNISSIVKFVTNSYYGARAGRLLDSARALLYRDGWEMGSREWDGIDSEFAAEIIGYEGFYVPTEYARYCFVRDLINWRLENGNSSSSSARHTDQGSVESLKLGDNADSDSSHTRDYDGDVTPLQDLLQTGIYYIHMSFEDLQKIADETNFLGYPMIDQSIIKNALWQQMLLRQKVLNSPNDSADLGITTTEQTPIIEVNSTAQMNKYTNSKDSQSPRLIVSNKKYYIPTEDSTTVIGDCPEQPPQVIIAQRGTPRNISTNFSSLNIDVPKADTKESGSNQLREKLRYSQFPPFRFSAEFKSIRSLKEKKRVYSKTVFYAGSYWNIYIQKVKSSKNVQLGVYLHRAKDREGSGNASPTNKDGEVSHIGLAERGLDGLERRGPNGTPDSGDLAMATEGDVSSTKFNLDSTSRLGTNGSSNQSQVKDIINLEATVPTLGHYIDTRPMIQTYFKIFSPSRKGKMLSMFSSGPDSFNFSQSWGWKSSSLILEEGLITDTDKDTRLRFMVVLGNV